MLADLPRTRLVPVSIVKEPVEITWHMPEHSQQQRNLSPVMNTVIGPVFLTDP